MSCPLVGRWSTRCARRGHRSRSERAPPGGSLAPIGWLASALDLQARHPLLQLLGPRVGDSCTVEIDPGEPFQTFEVLEARIRYPGATQTQLAQADEPF